MKDVARAMALVSRRTALVSGLAVTLCGCGRRTEGDAPAAKPASKAMTLQDAASGPWRSPADKARDVWRHPVQSLEFWGLKPGQTVVEFWPGAGWYTDILAPYLKATGGKLYAAHFEVNNPDDPAADGVVEAYRAKLAAAPKIYGDVRITAFGPTTTEVAPAGSADLALFLRNLHNWMAAGIAEKAFRDAFAALKPGGKLGIEEHRAAPGGVQDPLSESGYVQEAYVQQFAREAGFVFEAASDINANPKDTRDHPFGVWTLPPVRRTSPRGQPDDPAFGRSKYDAIGESDRMTLRFRKPG